MLFRLLDGSPVSRAGDEPKALGDALHRLGRRVYVTLQVTQGERSVEVAFDGRTLRHEVAEGLAEGEMVDPANIGWYSIGEYEEDEEGVHLDLSNLEQVKAHVIPWPKGEDSLVLELRDGVSIHVQVAPV